MDVSKLFTKICQLFEQFIVHCKWYAGEIHPEVLGKAFTVLIAELIQKLRIDIESPLCGGKDVFFVLVWVDIKGEYIGYLTGSVRDVAAFRYRA